MTAWARSLAKKKQHWEVNIYRNFTGRLDGATLLMRRGEFTPCLEKGSTPKATTSKRLQGKYQKQSHLEKGKAQITRIPGRNQNTSEREKLRETQQKNDHQKNSWPGQKDKASRSKKCKNPCRKKPVCRRQHMRDLPRWVGGRFHLNRPRWRPKERESVVPDL